MAPLPSRIGILPRRTATRLGWLPLLFAAPVLVASFAVTQWILGLERTPFGRELVEGYRIPGALLAAATDSVEKDSAGFPD